LCLQALHSGSPPLYGGFVLNDLKNRFGGTELSYTHPAKIHYRLLAVAL
jgi:hypothetical protein